MPRPTPASDWPITNLCSYHHKPKSILQMLTLKCLSPETKLRRKSTLLSNFLCISNTLSRDLAPVNKLSRDLAPGNMDMREICVRRRRPLRRQFVGFVCHIALWPFSAVCISWLYTIFGSVHSDTHSALPRRVTMVIKEFSKRGGNLSRTAAVRLYC